MLSRRSFFHASIAGGAGMIMVPKLLDRFKWRKIDGLYRWDDEPQWFSSDPTIVSVDEHGMITHLRPGSASITCVVNSKMEMMHSCRH